MTRDLIVFFSLALIAVVTALSMLASKNAIYAAVFLVLNFVTVAILYLLLNATFIALVQVTVYAGAIMVLFLFVIMLLGAERIPGTKGLRWQAPTAVALAVALLAEIALVLWARGNGIVETGRTLSEAFGSPRAIGGLLFNKFLIPFEITSLILLVAMVGAIVLSRAESKENS